MNAVAPHRHLAPAETDATSPAAVELAEPSHNEGPARDERSAFGPVLADAAAATDTDAAVIDPAPRRAGGEPPDDAEPSSAHDAVTARSGRARLKARDGEARPTVVESPRPDGAPSDERPASPPAAATETKVVSTAATVAPSRRAAHAAADVFRQTGAESSTEPAAGRPREAMSPASSASRPTDRTVADPLRTEVKSELDAEALAPAPAEPPPPAPATPLLAHAAHDPTLAVAVLPKAAHVCIRDHAGDLALHVRLRDGQAEIRIAGTMAPLFEARAPEARAALAGQGFALGSFDLDSGGGGGDRREDAAAPVDPPPPSAAAATRSPCVPTPRPSAPAADDRSRIHVTA